MIASILTIVGSLFSIFAAYYLQKTIRSWLQRRATAQQIKDSTNAVADAEKTVATIDKQHQSLKDIEGR